MKKFLAALLAIALVITGLYPTQWAKAATTTTTGEGLDFWTPEYDYYYSQNTFSATPMTFEATVKVSASTDIWIPGYIMANTNVSSGTAMGEGFALGFGKGHCPQLVIVDEGTVTEYNFLKDPTTDTYGSAAYYSTFRGKEVHLAVVNDTSANQMYCYVNGVLFATIDGAFTGTITSVSPMIIGSDYRTQRTKSFKGSVKNVAVFSTARTATQVASDYSNSITGSETGLMAAYELGLGSDGTYATTLSDLSGQDTMTRQKRLLSWAEKEAIYELGDWDYSMAVIGDPQVLAAHDAKGDSYPEGGDPYVDGQTARMFDWVVGNKDDLKMKWAFNLGDTTDSYAANGTEDLEWDISSAAVKKLDGQLPYSIVRGNHDATGNYTEHFAWADYKDNVSGSYEENMLNTYQKFEVNGIKYMVVNLDFGISSDLAKANNILRWANNVVATNPEYNVIVTTHGYLTSEGVRNGQEFLDYYDGQVTKSAENMWDEFIKLHSNIVMVISGHVDAAPVIKREVYGVNGNKVVELAVNAQEDDVAFAGNLFKKNETDTFNTMTGAVGMMYFSNGGKNVSFEYYSTLWNQYYTEQSQIQFTLDLVDADVFEKEDGTVALAYSQVDTTGSVPAPSNSAYADYIFAGWYTGAGCTLDMAITDSANVTSASYAKFVPKDLLNVKAQVSTTTMASGSRAGNWAMRFVSSVDDTTYKSVGFKVTNKETGALVGESSANHVYKKISSSESELSYGFSPEVISDSSAYVFTVKMPVADTEAAKATDYVVQAYYETFDGTKVYGPKRVVSANDGISGSSINMVVNAELTGTGYTATYTKGIYANTVSDAVDVTVLLSEDGTSNIRIPVATKNLTSASKIVISDANGTEVATEIHRNYYSNEVRSYQDFSWYYVNPDADKFVVASSSDLYGWEALAYQGIYLEGKTVELISDVVINEGKAVAGEGSTAPSWVDDDSTIYKWVPIGRFNGTFDGNGNTVSGVYLDNSAEKTGFFKELYPEAKVMDFGIINSYIKTNNKDYAGALAGHSYAKLIKNVYSDAVIDCGNCTGGLIGMVEPYPATTEMVFEQCWFDGEIYVSGYGGTGGGLVGYIYDAAGGKIRFTDCMFSGDLYEYGTYSYPNFGGILGSNRAANVGTTLTFQNCLNVGTMASTHSTGGFGAIVAYANKGYVSSKGYNCWSVESSAYAYNCPSGGELQFSDSGIVTREELLFATNEEVYTKLPLLSGQSENAWICNVSDGVAGTPILKQFSTVWLKKQQ